MSTLTFWKYHNIMFIPYDEGEPMKYQKDAEGWYTVPAGPTAGGTMKTKLCPIDSTTTETWAQSLIQKGQDAMDHGFGLCWDGTPYDLDNFLADTLVGNVPWDDEGFKELYNVMHAQPNFARVMTEFKAKFGRTYFHQTLEDELYFMNHPQEDE